jgi:peptidyl-prolyl cis-trans isomerase A (cyclophilin A)
MRLWITMLCSALLTACVGNGNTTPTVTDIQAFNLGYGQKATFEFIGTYLDLGLNAKVPHCTGQTPAYLSATQQALSCNVTTAGPLTIEVTNSADAVIFSKTFTVPAPQVALVTTQGTITVELDPVAAPLSVDNVLRYVNGNFYNGILFHRVIAGFVIQAGGFTSGLVPRNSPLAPIPLESNNGLTNLRGTLAMARTADPNSATAQFYFNLVDNPSLNYRDASNPGYAVFGKIITGLDVMDAIGAAPTAVQNGLTDVPVTEVLIRIALRTQ